MNGKRFWLVLALVLSPCATAATPPEASDLDRRVAQLVKTSESALPVPTEVAPERAAIAHEIVEVTRARESLTLDSDLSMSDSPAAQRLPPRLREAMVAVAKASFREDAVLASFEHKLAAELDVATMEVGLKWERSELGQRMIALDVALKDPQTRAEHKRFVEEFVAKGGNPSDARARACAQADVLSETTGTALVVLEAIAVGGAMSVGAQQQRVVSVEEIAKVMATVRPYLREAARQAVLATCLFAYKGLTDSAFEEWLRFLRSDEGGRYARGKNSALRDALLLRSEVFARTLLEVARDTFKQPV